LRRATNAEKLHLTVPARPTPAERPAPATHAGQHPLALFALLSPFPHEPGMLRLLEPPGSDAQELRTRLLSGTYDKPFLREHDGIRSLYFSMRFIQSAMRLDEPDALHLAYTKRMMAFLLFNPEPRSIVLLGLGGGSLGKFCYRHLPLTSFVALEVDPDVLALRDAFCVPPDDERFRVIHGDGVRYVAEQASEIDVLLVDTFDAAGVAPALAQGDFFRDTHRCLAPDGVLVMNFAGPKETYAPHVERLHRHFGDNTIAISVRDDANFVLFAFKNPGVEFRWEAKKALAPRLRTRFGLDFHSLARQLERGHRLQLARRMVA
jgi:spermidine synthase